MSLLPRFLLAAAAIALVSPGAMAQNATTTPVGVVNVQLDANQRTAISLPLEKPAVAFGNVTAVTPTTIVAASGNFTSFSNSHFLRVTSGNATGRMFRITSNDATTFTLNTGSTTWNLPVDSSSANTVDIKAGDRFEIVPMWTLSEVFGGNGTTTVLRAATNPNSADIITVYVDGAQQAFFNNQTNWRNATNPGDTTNYNTYGLLPTAGLWIIRRSTGSNAILTFTGNVPATAPRFQMPGGASFSAAIPLPGGASLSNLRFGNMTAWTRNNNPNSADQVTVYRPDRTFTTFFLNNSGVWRNATNPGDTQNYADVEIPAGSGLWIRRRGAATGPSANAASVLPYSLN